MVEPAVLLAALGMAGLSPSAAILGLRHREARNWASGLDPYRLVVPSGCDPAALQRFFASLTGLLPGRWERHIRVRGIGIEVDSSNGSIAFYLLIPHNQADIVTGSLRAHLPNARLVPEPSYEPSVPTLAGELMTVRPHHQLGVDDPAAVSTGILAALQPLEEGEHLTLQMLLLPLMRFLPPDDPRLRVEARTTAQPNLRRRCERSTASPSSPPPSG